MGLKTVQQISAEIASRIKVHRINRQFTQAKVSELSGVPLSTYKRFEQKGFISVEALIKVAITLNLEQHFDSLFVPEEIEFETLDQVEQSIQRSDQRKIRMRARL